MHKLYQHNQIENKTLLYYLEVIIVLMYIVCIVNQIQILPSKEKLHVFRDAYAVAWLSHHPAAFVLFLLLSVIKESIIVLYVLIFYIQMVHVAK